MKPEEHLGELIKIKIDRPLGSKHPKHGFIYPINYGYVPGVISGDGEELDAYLLGIFEPVEEYEGHLIGIIYREDDVEEKIVVASKTYSADQIMALVEFQERWFHSWLAHHYNKPYWPGDFTVDMPEVQEAIKTIVKDGEFSLVKIAPVLKQGYGHCVAFGSWLTDNGIIEKLSKTDLKIASTMKAKSKVKTYEEAIQKINWEQRTYRASKKKGRDTGF